MTHYDLPMFIYLFIYYFIYLFINEFTYLLTYLCYFFECSINITVFLNARSRRRYTVVSSLQQNYVTVQLNNAVLSWSKLPTGSPLRDVDRPIKILYFRPISHFISKTTQDSSILNLECH